MAKDDDVMLKGLNSGGERDSKGNYSGGEGDDADMDDIYCGLGPCRPKALQVWFD